MTTWPKPPIVQEAETYRIEVLLYSNLEKGSRRTRGLRQGKKKTSLIRSGFTVWERLTPRGWRQLAAAPQPFNEFPSPESSQTLRTVTIALNPRDRLPWIIEKCSCSTQAAHFTVHQVVRARTVLIRWTTDQIRNVCVKHLVRAPVTKRDRWIRSATSLTGAFISLAKGCNPSFLIPPGQSKASPPASTSPTEQTCSNTTLNLSDTS